MIASHWEEEISLLGSVLHVSDSPLCMRCVAEDETLANISYECEALASLSHVFLSSPFLDLEDIKRIFVLTRGTLHLLRKWQLDVHIIDIFTSFQWSAVVGRAHLTPKIRTQEWSVYELWLLLTIDYSTLLISDFVWLVCEFAIRLSHKKSPQENSAASCHKTAQTSQLFGEQDCIRALSRTVENLYVTYVRVW